MSIFVEKRRHLRFNPEELEAVICSDQSIGTDSALIEDISFGGIRFQCKTEFPVGDDVLVNLYYLPINVVGCINRIEKRGGVFIHATEFKEVTSISRIKLGRYIAESFHYVNRSN